MKAIKISTGIYAFFVLACTASFADADTAWVVPASTQLVSPVQKVLRDELAMPGVGIEASKKQILNRLQYALEHEWLPAEQIDQQKSELKDLVENPEYARDEAGNLTFESKMLLARQLFKFNARFEQTVLKEEKQRR